MPTIVECLSSSTYAERPLALTWEGQRHKIGEIFAQWRTPGEVHFRVHTDLGAAFELIYHEATAERPEKASGCTWQVQPISGG